VVIVLFQSDVLLSIAHRFHMSCMGHVLCMWQAALTYVTKCKALQGEWLKFNHMTERMEYLHMTQSVQEKMTKRWALIVEGMEGAQKVQGMEGVQKVQGMEGMQKAKGVQKAVQGKKRSRAAEGPEDDVEKKIKNNIDTVLGKAMRTKNQYFVVTGAVAALRKKVASDEATMSLIF